MIAGYDQQIPTEPVGGLGLFEQAAVDFGTRAFVVYNPRDEQVATGHAMDLPQFSPEHLERTAGTMRFIRRRMRTGSIFWFD